jgi:hypothetical protein
MNTHKVDFAGCLALGILMAASGETAAQYAPPPASQPFAGFVNEALRKHDRRYIAWDISGSVRLRYELRDGALGLPPANDFRDQTTATTQNENEYFSDKILARVAYSAPWWGIFVEGRSSSTLGDERSPTGSGGVPSADGGDSGPETDDPVELHQAYVRVGNPKEFPLSLKVGRQELSYGDERLVGPFGWNNIGRVFDAVKLRWEADWGAAEAFSSKLVLPDDNNFNTWNDYNVFSGLHITSKQVPHAVAELYFFARNDGVGSASANPGAVLPQQTSAPAARDIYTVGARIKSNPGELGAFDYSVESAIQFGSWKPAVASARLDHQAYAFVANVGYTFADAPGKPRVALEYAHGSGDSDPADGDHETFDNLYPTNHKFYGYMDLLAWQNTHDARAMLQIRPLPKLSLALEAHLFWLAETADSFYNAGGIARTTPGSTPAGGDGFGLNPGYDSFVGGEIDLIAGYALAKFAALEAGYGHFFAGDYIRQTWSGAGFGSRDADWFYIQTVLRF